MRNEEFTATFAKPFDEATSFFRDKLNIPTDHWAELEGNAMAKGFTSAGAYQADLLSDLRKMTDKAIAGGMNIREFREQFLPLVGRHGWQLKGGGAAWRSDLIWRTNISTAFQAGRWQQFVAGNVEYLMYKHKDGQLFPRPHHEALDKMVFPRGDVFWRYNYPPQGFGCKCRAVAATRGEYDAASKERKRLPENYREMADPGWNYNVGIAGEEKGYAALTAKFESMDNAIARAWVARFTQEPAFERFVDGKIKGEFPVAVLRSKDMKLLEAGSQTVWLSDDSLAKNKGEQPTRSAGHPDLDVADYRLLPEIIDNGEVYLQGDDRLIILRVGDVAYRAAVKRTRDSSRNYLLSLFKAAADGKAVRQVREKGYVRIR